jgi:hypothetical protein
LVDADRSERSIAFSDGIGSKPGHCLRHVIAGDATQTGRGVLQLGERLPGAAAAHQVHVRSCKGAFDRRGHDGKDFNCANAGELGVLLEGCRAIGFENTGQSEPAGRLAERIRTDPSRVRMLGARRPADAVASMRHRARPRSKRSRAGGRQRFAWCDSLDSRCGWTAGRLGCRRPAPGVDFNRSTCRASDCSVEGGRNGVLVAA